MFSYERVFSFFLLHRISLTLNSCSCNNLLSLQSLCTRRLRTPQRHSMLCVFTNMLAVCVCADQNVCPYKSTRTHSLARQCCCSACKMLCSLCSLDFFARSCSSILFSFCFSASAKCEWKISAHFFYLYRYRISVCFKLQSRREKEQAQKKPSLMFIFDFLLWFACSFFSPSVATYMNLMCCSSCAVCVCVFCIRGESPAIKILWLNVLLCVGVAIMIGFALPKWT